MSSSNEYFPALLLFPQTAWLYLQISSIHGDLFWQQIAVIMGRVGRKVTAKTHIMNALDTVGINVQGNEYISNFTGAGSGSSSQQKTSSKKCVHVLHIITVLGIL